MSLHNGHAAGPADADDRIAELLADYDDALASGSSALPSIPLDEFDADTVAHIERLESKLRHCIARRAAAPPRPPIQR